MCPQMSRELMIDTSNSRKLAMIQGGYSNFDPDLDWRLERAFQKGWKERFKKLNRLQKRHAKAPVEERAKNNGFHQQHSYRSFVVAVGIMIVDWSTKTRRRAPREIKMQFAPRWPARSMSTRRIS